MFQRFFEGRYGIDILGIVMMIVSSLLFRNGYTWIIGMGLIIYAIFRILSKNKGKRYQELQKFNNFLNFLKPIWEPIRRAFYKVSILFQSNFKTERMKWNQRKQFVFFKCSKCSRTLRLPRGKGKLQVTCPNCKTQTYKVT